MRMPHSALRAALRACVQLCAPSARSRKLAHAMCRACMAATLPAALLLLLLLQLLPLHQIHSNTPQGGLDRLIATVVAASSFPPKTLLHAFLSVLKARQCAMNSHFASTLQSCHISTLPSSQAKSQSRPLLSYTTFTIKLAEFS